MPRPLLACWSGVALLAVLGRAAQIALPVEQREGPVAVKGSGGAQVDVLFDIFGNTSFQGYYVSSLGIGNPPQYFDLLLDTGSSVVHVQGKGCGDRCTLGSSPEDGYDRNSSLSGRAAECGDECYCSYCRCDSARGVCTYDIKYGNAGSSGDMLIEQLYLSRSPNVTLEVFFGVESQESGSLQTLSTAGMLGLNQAPASFISQLTRQRLINGSFAMCWQSPLANSTGRSYLLLGDRPEEVDLQLVAGGGSSGSGSGGASSSGSGTGDLLQYTPLKERQTNYYVTVEGLSVGDKAIDLSSTQSSSSSSSSTASSALVDSGNTYTVVPSSVQSALQAEIIRVAAAAGLQVQKQEAKRTCWSDASLTDLTDDSPRGQYFPTLTFTFPGGGSFTADPENYLFKPAGYAADTACLSIFGGSQWVLGNSIRQRVLTHYDLANQRVGFMSVGDCQDVADVWLAAGDGSTATA